jgi:hypothetical protein
MKSKYDKSKNVLIEQPEYEDACSITAIARNEERKKCCRTIPCSENNWKDGQELILDKDYKLEKRYVEPPNDIHCNRGGDVLFAIPIVAQETEDELWEEVGKTIFNDFAAYTDEKITIEFLKSIFTIKRKTS